MANQIGVATNPNDLLDKLRIWLLTRSWILDVYQVDGAGYRLHMHKGSIYLNFRSYNAETPTPYRGSGSSYGIAFNTGTGYDSGLNWYSQPGTPILLPDYYYGTPNPGGTGIILGPGPYQSHQFFDDGADNYLVMVERAPGIWRKLCWGASLDKSGAGGWTGGAYFSGFTTFGYWSDANIDPGSAAYSNYPPMGNCQSGGNALLNAFVRADVDTFVGKWLALAPSTGTARITGRAATNALICDWLCDWTQPPKYDLQLISRLYNQQDCRSILMPLQIYAERDGGGMSFLGTVPSLAVSATSKNGLGLGQDLQVGSEVWRQFNGFLVKVVP